MRKKIIKRLLRPVDKAINKLLCPIHNSYAGYKIFNLLQKLTGYFEEKLHFFWVLGYYPDLKNPKSFNEKVLWKKFYDRNPLLPIISDKYMVRKYLKEILGRSEAEKILVPLFYVTDKPETIPFDNLPEEYIIKPNHASGQLIIVENTGKEKRYTIIQHGKSTILFDCKRTRKEVISICKNWLSLPFGFRHLEWAYQPIKRKIVVEKLLRDFEGKPPEECKFKIFCGKCQLILFIQDRFINTSRGWYTPEWKYVYVKDQIKMASPKKKPENLESMIDLSELIGKPFDFIRVDLYSVNNCIYFGELTNYPTSGRTPFNPVSFDFELGSKWKVTPEYWK